MVQCGQECHLLSYLSVGLEGRGGKGEGREGGGEGGSGLCWKCTLLVNRETSQWVEQVGRENMCNRPCTLDSSYLLISTVLLPL